MSIEQIELKHSHTVTTHHGVIKAVEEGVGGVKRFIDIPVILRQMKNDERITVTVEGTDRVLTRAEIDSVLKYLEAVDVW